MITDGFQFIALLFFSFRYSNLLEKKFKNGAFFKYIPAGYNLFWRYDFIYTGSMDMNVESVSKARGVLKKMLYYRQ